MLISDADERLVASGSVGEAAFMTGLERNADIVFAASYAPLLGVSISYLLSIDRSRTHMRI